MVRIYSEILIAVVAISLRSASTAILFLLKIDISGLKITKKIQVVISDKSYN